MRTTIIVNRKARGLVEQGPLLRLLRGPRPGVRVVETHSVEELGAAVHRLGGGPSERVVLAGGDGSYMAGVTALCRVFGPDRLPSIALVGGGTVSTVARNLSGLGRSATRHAERLLDAIALGRTNETTHATLRVRDDHEE